jgi:hypothetical protein
MDKLIAIALGDEGSLNLTNITSDDEGHESLESPDGGGLSGDAVPNGESALVIEEVQENDP